MIADLPPAVEELFPFAPHFVDVAGSMLHYVDEGPRSTDAVVLLHGNPTWSFLYRRIIPEVVAAGWRVIAPDHLGCGRSDQGRLAGQYPIALHAARLLSVLEHAGVRRAVFFLQDWGGPIGMAASLSRPGLFAGAVLGNTFWGRGSSFHHEPFPWRILHGPLAGPLLFDRRPVFVNGAALGMPSDLPDAVLAAYALPWQVNGGAGATLAWPRAIALDDDSPTAPLADAIWEWMASADVPLRWVWGASDVVFPPSEQYEAMADRFPRGRDHPPVLVDDGRHFIQEWAPGECAEALVAVAAEAFAGVTPDGEAAVAPVAHHDPDRPSRPFVPPLPVLDDDVAAEHADAIGPLHGPWEAPSGRHYLLGVGPSRLRVDLQLPPDRVVPLPSGELIDEDLLALAGVIADRIGPGWSARGVRNAARVWGSWDRRPSPAPGWTLPPP